jgi:hypothetical protein
MRITEKLIRAASDSLHSWQAGDKKLRTHQNGICAFYDSKDLANLNWQSIQI